VVVEEEARAEFATIFRRLSQALAALTTWMADLRERGIVTKVRSLKTGRTIRGMAGLARRGKDLRPW